MQVVLRTDGKKPLSTAVEEIYKGRVHILPEEEETEEEE